MSIKLDALAIRYHAGQLQILDQQLLPLETVWLSCHSIDDMCMMIKDLKVRGAPLIGIAAVLALMQFVEQGAQINDLIPAMEKLVATRPTAINLKNYMLDVAQELNGNPKNVLITGQRLFLEDVRLCDEMAQFGAQLLPTEATVMTYCNTGGLATAGLGTALGVIKQGFKQGKIKHVFVNETRPLLQGGRLTAWELNEARIPYTLICDNMAATVMGHQKIDAILVGADRIARNGDVANKIGTYSLAVLAKHHQIPFYVVAPYTTLCARTATGKEIEIELRDENEVRGALGRLYWTPEKAPTFNPSFDVTPHQLITGYILDKGVFKADSLHETMVAA